MTDTAPIMPTDTVASREVGSPPYTTDARINTLAATGADMPTPGSEPQFEEGDRFEDQDPRNEGRVIELETRKADGKWSAVTEVHPNNPEAVGNHVSISDSTLADSSKYRKISR